MVTVEQRELLLQTLTPRQFRALALYYDHDRPHTQQEIAAKFGVGRRAIGLRIRDGLNNLRRAGLPIPPRPGGRAPKHTSQLSACGSQL